MKIDTIQYPLYHITYKYIHVPVHSGPENLKKSGPKKHVKANKSI